MISIGEHIMWFLILIGLILIICLSIVFLKIRKKKYEKYLLENSIALKELLIINNKYNFYNNVNNFNESHIYDNENFYNNISCEDYLIYQLQYKKYDIEKGIKYISYNKEKYILYSNEISKINEFGRYVNINNKLNHHYLLTIEKELFNKNKLNPLTYFNIKVILYCSKINGVIYNSKTQNFSS